MHDRFDKLVARGREVLATRESPPPRVMGPDRVNRQLASGWAASAQNAIDEVFGDRSAYGTRFRDATREPISYSDALKAQGILEAASRDLADRELSSAPALSAATQVESQTFRFPRFQLGILLGAGLGWVLCLRRAEIAAALSSPDGIRTGKAAAYIAVILGGIVCGNLFSNSVHEHGWVGAFRAAPVRTGVYLIVAAAGVFFTLKAATFF